MIQTIPHSRKNALTKPKPISSTPIHEQTQANTHPVPHTHKPPQFPSPCHSASSPIPSTGSHVPSNEPNKNRFLKVRNTSPYKRQEHGCLRILRAPQIQSPWPPRYPFSHPVVEVDDANEGITASNKSQNRYATLCRPPILVPILLSSSQSERPKIHPKKPKKTSKNALNHLI